MNERPSVQSVRGKEFQDNKEISCGYRAMIRIMNEKLWSNRDKNGKYIYENNKHFINSKRVEEILQEEIPEVGKSDIYSGKLPGIDELNSLSKKLTNGFISTATKTGLIPMDLVILTGKITRGSDIEVLENGEGGLNFDHGKGNKPEVYISTEIIRNRMDIIFRAAEKNGIKISVEQSLAAAITSTAAHEYGHSVDRAIGYEFERKAESLPGKLGEKSRDNLAVTNFGSDISAREAERIASPIFENLDNKNGDVDCIHRERLATTFEFEGLKYGLIQTGVTKEQSEILIEAMRKSRYNGLIELSNVIDNLKMNQSDLASYCLDLRSKTKKIGLESGYIPFLWNSVGYCAPYTNEQVREILSESNEKIKNTKFIKDSVKKIIRRQARRT